MKARNLIWLSLVLTAGTPSNQKEGNADADSPVSGLPSRVKNPEELQFKQNTFTFVRITYGGRGRVSMWQTDYPDSDWNFSARFQQATGLKTDPEGKILELTDAELNQFPFIYLVEGGNMTLNAAETRSLRQYLLGGGFLMADDFWGEQEWKNFAGQMKQVFPDREAVELPIDHPIFHCFYDLREKPQVPNVALGIQSQFTGVTWEREDARQPHYRGIFDDNGRLMAIFCHNTDLGDGWERESENAYYYNEFSQKKAYPMGINIVVYALTH